VKRSILGLIYFIHAIDRAGVDVAARLKKIGLKLDEIDHTALIHPTVDWDIFEVIAQDIHPEQGLWIGQQYTLTGYGPLLMLMLASPNLQVAFEKGEQYHALTHLVGHIQLQRYQHKMMVFYQPDRFQESSSALLRAQTEVSATFKFIQELFKMMRMSLPDILVKLPFDQPHHPEMLAQYRAFYGQNVEFSTERAEFYFADDILAMPLPTANTYSFKTLDQQCAAELKRLLENQNEPVIVQRVKDYLDLQQHMIPSMQQTAVALRMPERTLRHQLQLAKTSYKAIREQRIKLKALELMKSDLYSIEQIAEILGYSESAAFNHAFKRWFGQSPKKFINS
jgi:AraC-like DNA-binding protein